MRRKRVFTEYFEQLDKAFEYIKRVKDINGRQVEVEMSELFDGYCVNVWKVR